MVLAVHIGRQTQEDLALEEERGQLVLERQLAPSDEALACEARLTVLTPARGQQLLLVHKVVEHLQREQFSTLLGPPQDVQATANPQSSAQPSHGAQKETHAVMLQRLIVH